MRPRTSSYGERRGDELPEQLSTPEGRREFLRKAKQQDQEAERQEPEPEPEREGETAGRPLAGLSSMPSGSSLVSRVGRGGCVTLAASLSSTAGRTRTRSRGRAESGCCWRPSGWRPISPLSARGTRRMSSYRAAGRMKDGRRFGGPPKPYTPPEIPAGKVNVTDPDSKRMKAYDGYVQGYNAQAVVDEGQIVLAAEITNSGVDWSQFAPMVTATIGELERAGVSARPETALADAQYWNEQHIDEVIANKHIQVLVPPDGGARGKQRPGWTGGRYTFMRHALASELGRQLYRKRKHMIEPVFGSHQTQPGYHQLSPTRPDRRADRVAISDGDPQPDQAPPTHNRHPKGLKGAPTG